jgi:hypothetical protein
LPLSIMDAQFVPFCAQLDGSSTLHDRICIVVAEVESTLLLLGPAGIQPARSRRGGTLAGSGQEGVEGTVEEKV